MNNKNFLILLCVVILACGCINKAGMSKLATAGNGAAQNEMVKTTDARQDHVIELLTFIDSYSNLAPEVQKKVFAETNKILADNKNDLIHRIKLASMFALPSSRMRDNAKAHNLLQDLLQENTLNPPDSALVSLLYEYTVDQTRQLQKAKDDIKKLETIQQKYEALEQKNTALEQKLSELKNIEKTMNERDAKPGN